MAYSPIFQGRVPTAPALGEIARKHGVTPMQVALAWVLRRPGAIVIPKASSVAHVRENADATRIKLDDADLAALDKEFPPPKRKVPLAMI